jgi:hypothetical protein
VVKCWAELLPLRLSQANVITDALFRFSLDRPSLLMSPLVQYHCSMLKALKIGACMSLVL